MVSGLPPIAIPRWAILTKSPLLICSLSFYHPGASLPVHLLVGRVWRLPWPLLWILISRHLERGEGSACMDEGKDHQLLMELLVWWWSNCHHCFHQDCRHYFSSIHLLEYPIPLALHCTVRHKKCDISWTKRGTGWFFHWYTPKSSKNKQFNLG